MFGKRKQDQEQEIGESSIEEERVSHDPDLTEALLELGRNRHAPLPEPETSDDDVSAADSRDDLDPPTDEDRWGPAPERTVPPLSDAPGVPAWANVPTAAMLAEPEPEPEADDVPSAAEMAMQALNRQRAKTAEQEAALRQAQDEAAELKLQLEDLRAELAQRPEAGASSGDESGLQSKVSELAAELENARADAAAAGVALERLERESTDQEAALAAAEERAERLEAEVARLGEAASRTIGVGGAAGGEVALLTALDQTRAATAQIESIVAENRRLADELAAMLRSQEALVAALTGLQTEVTEQRAWFEAQLASARESEVQQAGVVDALQSGLKEKEAELEALREQLLDVEAKRAEEAAAFVAALERQ